jgi:putative endonuclease
MSDDARQILGKQGEDLACAELERLGYAILDRRYRTRVGEIDIVASQEGVTVFVEVKTRVGERFGGGEEAITAWKQRRLTQMAVDYRPGIACTIGRAASTWSPSTSRRDGRAFRYMLTPSTHHRRSPCLN